MSPTTVSAAPEVRPRTGFVERRRPGRLENPNPALVPLMREPAAAEAGGSAEWELVAETDLWESADKLAPARGLLVGVGLGLLLWCFILSWVWWFWAH